jgi:Ca2+-binding RTX toxin-like protein
MKSKLIATSNTLAERISSMYRHPATRSLACSVVASVALAACGGGDDNQDPSVGVFSTGSEGVNVRMVLGGERADALSGSDDRTYVWGLQGDDQLVAGARGGNLYGDSGNDTLVGMGGQDRLTGGKGNDSLYGGAQMDALRGGEGDDFLDEGPGHGDLDGGPGNDTLVGGPGPDAFAISPTSGNDVIRDFTAGPGMFDHLAVMDLRWQDLTFTDTPAGVRISWTGGSVLLEGVRRADLAQDDFMFAMEPDLPPGTRAPAGPAPERPSPSTNGPTITGESSGGPLPDRLTFQGDERYRIVIGNDTGDSIEGTDAWDHLIGRDGNDTVTGGAGDDILEGNGGNDSLVGGAGRDKLLGGPGNDTLMGGEDEDELQGGDGDDVLDAGAGHDMIEGGKGNDTITGGRGADAFIVSPESGDDVVLDFEATGAAQGAFDHIAFMDIMPEHVSVTDTADGARVSWDTNGDGVAEGSVLLRGVPKANLRQSDFMFVPRPGFVAGIEALGSYYIFPAD